jgi:hypothetical protein
MLVMIGLMLVVQRAVRILIGLAAASLVLLGSSMLLLGQDGFARIANVWLSYSAGAPNTGVESMINWRMLGLDLSNLAGAQIGWGLAGAGMLATVLLTLWAWKQRLEPASPRFQIGILAALAATLTVAWHSHAHAALILVPSLMSLREKGLLPERVLAVWVLVPALLFVGALIPLNLMKLNVLPDETRQFVYFLRGVGEFGVCLYLLGWAARRMLGKTKTQ